MASSSLASLPWWRSGVVYQIYPRSFADGNGDGVGDLAGISERLDHLAWLGVDAVWLSPIYPSPLADFGYDVSDYCDIDPTFGTLADFDRLVAEAHRRGIRVILDWVANHTSNRHPWFEEAASSREHPRRDWYLWRDPAPGGGPPNNWKAAFGNPKPPAWTLHEPTGQYYLHCFLPEQPDLNWGNPDVRRAMADVLRFWLDRGVDGFRADVVHLLGKDPALPDDPPDRRWPAHVRNHDDPSIHPILRDIRALLDSYPGERIMVGEVVIFDPERLARYYGKDDELHLCFNFAGLAARWDPLVWRSVIERTTAAFAAGGAWPSWVLSNHDNPRHRTRFGGSEARARAAAVLLLTLPGTPFLYAGEELGLQDGHVPPERIVDPDGRDGCRTPVPWTAAPPHGWEGDEPWLPMGADAPAANAERQRADRSSVLWLYRRLLAARRRSPALHGGTFRWLDTPDGVLGWERAAGVDRRHVYVNFGADAATVPAGGRVHLSSWDGARPPEPWTGHLPGDGAVVVQPA